MEVEITEIPAVTPAERSMLGMHPLLNILTVLQGELTLLGLTKALFVTKQFGGRFWIKSEVGAGTRIRLVIPRPKAA